MASQICHALLIVDLFCYVYVVAPLVQLLVVYSLLLRLLGLLANKLDVLLVPFQSVELLLLDLGVEFELADHLVFWWFLCWLGVLH